VFRCFCGCGRRVGVRDWTADRHGRQTGWLVQSLADATEMLSLDGLTTPAYTRVVTAAHEWQGIWVSVVHGEARSGDVDVDGWRRWRDTAIAMLHRTMDAYEARWLEDATATGAAREADPIWTSRWSCSDARGQCAGRERRRLPDRAHDRRRRDHQRSPAD
jgi:hypothetical protein